jgi:hypothetical protein|tara:strand:+ start:60 stop:455 length:396 start_codon:yes stop_codon:yes gene_type:complete
MVYQIDIALDIRKNNDFSYKKKLIINNANDNECSNYYENYEFGGLGRRILRNHIVLTFIFSKETGIIKFIKFIKNKTKAYIEMIGYDNCIFELIFASKKYLTFMERDLMREYKKNRSHLLKKYKNIVNELK